MNNTIANNIFAKTVLFHDGGLVSLMREGTAFALTGRANAPSLAGLVSVVFVFLFAFNLS